MATAPGEDIWPAGPPLPLLAPFVRLAGTPGGCCVIEIDNKFTVKIESNRVPVGYPHTDAGTSDRLGWYMPVLPDSEQHRDRREINKQQAGGEWEMKRTGRGYRGNKKGKTSHTYVNGGEQEKMGKRCDERTVPKQPYRDNVLTDRSWCEVGRLPIRMRLVALVWAIPSRPGPPEPKQRGERPQG